MPNSILPTISLVVPCYNEQNARPVFINKTTDVISSIPNIDYEIIFVDDGSLDVTLPVLRQLARPDLHVKYISFSRNFGKEAAMLAGLEKASGDFVAVMDVDLQDPPELLPFMYDAITKEGFDCAATRRMTRKGEPLVRSFFAKLFYRIINRISDTEIVDGARDHRLMTRQVVDAILSLKEYNRFSKGIFSWVGFKSKWIEYEHIPRAAGETKWNFWTLSLYAIDGIISFSSAPLALASVFGILLCMLAFCSIIFIVIRRLLFGDPVAGWASLACIILFVSGVQLFCIGILGRYLAKNYMESKHRPTYIIQEVSEDKNTQTCRRSEGISHADIS